MMHRRCLGGTGIVICLVLAAVVGAGGVDLKCGADHECNMLPDVSDPAISRLLKCGACQLAVIQIAHAVIRKEAQIKKKMSEEAAVALLEGFCERGVLASLPLPPSTPCLLHTHTQSSATHFPAFTQAHSHPHICTQIFARICLLARVNVRPCLQT
jgi:hypothetical protein